MVFLSDDGNLIGWDDLPAPKQPVLMRNTGVCSACGVPGRMQPNHQPNSWWLVDVVHVGGCDKMMNTEWKCSECGVTAPTTRDGLTQLGCVGATATRPRTLYTEEYVRLVRAIEGENGSVSPVHQGKALAMLGVGRAGAKGGSGYQQIRNACTSAHEIEYTKSLIKCHQPEACEACT